jgi:cytochrome c oxidase assembly factor CtaG
MITGLIGLLLSLFSLALVVLAFIFWIWMLVDCIKNERLDSTQRIVWVLVIVFLHALGALIYYLAGRDRAGA